MIWWTTEMTWHAYALLAVFIMGVASALAILEAIEKFRAFRKRIDETEYVVRWLSRYEKELTILAIREQRKGEKRNASKNP